MSSSERAATEDSDNRLPPEGDGDEEFGVDDETVVAPEVHLNYRRWVRGSVALLLLMAAYVGIVLLMYPQAFNNQHQALLLPLIFVYFSLATTFLPLPTAPLVMWAAGPAGMDPLLLALVCTMGTGLANLHDYYLLSFLYRYKRMQRIRSTRFYAKAAKWFDKAPFITLSAASFLPIPIDLVRLLAISQGYARGPFTLASVLGRFPRYLAIALLTDRFNLGWQWVLGVLAVTILLGLGRMVPGLVQNLRKKKKGNA